MTTLTSFHGDGSYGTTPSPFPQSSSAPAAAPHSSQICQGCWIVPVLPHSCYVPSWLLFSVQEVCSSSLLRSSSMEITSIPLLACPSHLCIPPSHSVVPEILLLILSQFKGCWKGSAEICQHGQG